MIDHRLAHPPSEQERIESNSYLASLHPGNRFRLMLGMPLLPEPKKTMTTFEKLTQIFTGATLKWEHRGTLGIDPVVAIYYPSEEAFRSTLSLKPGGPSLTEEGEQMRKEAHRMRDLFIAEWPDGMCGFDIDKSSVGDRP